MIVYYPTKGSDVQDGTKRCSPAKATNAGTLSGFQRLFSLEHNAYRTMKTAFSIFSASLLACACLLSSVTPAFAQADEACTLPENIPAPDSDITTAAQVESGDATLEAFVDDYYAYALSFSISPLAAGYIGCILTSEGNWFSGDTYISTITVEGTVVLHGKDLLVSGRRINDDMLNAIATASKMSDKGGAFTFENDDGYARPYFNPDGSPAILIAGLDIKESHLVEETIDPGERPAVTAREVTDRESLKAFVNGALDHLLKIYETEGTDAILKIKPTFRDTTGYWRHGPTYLFLMDATGYTFFHGAFPERYELRNPSSTLVDAVTGDLILPKIIDAAMDSDEGAFVEYYFDNPDDDSDRVDIPKFSFARAHELEFMLPNGMTASFVTIIGAGIYGTEDDITQSVEPLDGEIPEAFALEQNYPNPFNPSTTIEFSLERAQAITLTVHDMLGREVRVLADGVQPAGQYSIPFDGTGLSGGAYLYVLRTGERVSVKKMTLLK